MGEYDFTLRCLTGHQPRQWATWLLGQPPDACELIETDLPRLEREADLLLQVTAAGATFLQHTEFQTRYDPDMPWRLLAYHAGFLVQHRLPVRSTVVWLTAEGYRPPEAMPWETRVAGEWELRFRYREICLWRLEPQEQLEQIEREGLWSLLPLVALMGETGQPAVVEQAVRRATQLPEGEERSDIVAGLAILGGLRYTSQWIYALLKEETVMESSVVVDIKERTARKARREYILQALAVRFGATPDDLIEPLGRIENLELLDHLHREAIRCDSLATFRQALREAEEER